MGFGQKKNKTVVIVVDLLVVVVVVVVVVGPPCGSVIFFAPLAQGVFQEIFPPQPASLSPP